ncbi:MAG: response regulator, partial [Sharpea porci]
MKSKIMIVDDEEHIRELVRFYLDKEGFECIQAANGEQAIEIIENQYIDLAIVDIMMPG